jgi:general secretion pathway protein N
MRRGLTLWGLAVFCVLVLLGSPAAFWVRGFSWPAGWAPQGVSGTLWQGQAQRMGQLSALSWSLSPSLDGVLGEWRGVALEHQWQLRLKGWPWAWNARLEALGHVPQAATAVRVAGNWQGHVQVHGAGAHCVNSEGELFAPRLALLAPWGMPLGAARLSLDCQASVRLKASLLQPGMHQLGFDGDLPARRAALSGDFEEASELAALLRQFGLLQSTQRHFAKTLDW